MTTLRWLTMPFKYSNDFYPQLNGWLSDVFYEDLPRAGFEVREEQIYSCYHIVNALAKKEPLMVEAGSGTGKTFAYLLPALCYARHTGKPVIIACSSATLQQQLVGETGDIATLSRILGLEIKAALAKDPTNYVCDVEAELARSSLAGQDKLLEWLETSPTGDRADIPEVADEIWSQISYNPSLDCQHCRRRGYCRLVKARQKLWQEQDFIICSHDVFFRDLWTRRERQQKVVRLFGMVESKTPYLPSYAGVVLDEGHLIEGAALRQMGVRITHQAVARLVNVVSNLPLVTDKLLYILQELETVSTSLFKDFKERAIPITSARWQLDISLELKEAVQEVLQVIDRAQDEMALYNQEDISQYTQELDSFSQGLSNLVGNKDILTWWQADQDSLWVLPREFSQALGEELLTQKKPVIFTSATLDAGDDFTYFKRITGIDAKTSQVSTSFDLPRQMSVYMPGIQNLEEKVQECHRLIAANNGRALILCNSPKEQEILEKALPRQHPGLTFIFEGKGESSWLIQRFREEKSSVMVGVNFWEGIDIPGDALTMVIIFSLPYPQQDPIILAKREWAKGQGLDPFRAVDFPAMQIKLRQGIGRLIRTREDYGWVAILEGDRQEVVNSIPQDVKILDAYPARTFG